MVLSVTPEEVPQSDLPESATQQSGTQEVPAEDIPSNEGPLLETWKAGIEGFRQGILGPIAALEEKYMPDTAAPEETRAEAERAANNPLARGAGEIAGLLTGPIGAGVGKLGTIGAEATNLGSIGSAAIKGAIEGGLFQGSDEISKGILGQADPTAPVSSALANIGAASLLGGTFGGLFGATGEGLKAVAATKATKAATDAIQEFGARWSLPSEADLAAENISARSLPKLKDNAQEIMDAADRLDAPVLNGMVSGDKLVRMGEDALLNGPPTVASIARQNAYSNAFEKISNAIDATIGAGEGALSETQAGNALKSSLIEKLEAENEPIKAMYDALGDYKKAIPVTTTSTNRIGQNILKLIEDQGLIKGTPEYNFVKTMSDGMSQITNLDQLANFRTALGRATDQTTRFVSGAIKDKLDSLEENAIRRFADTMKSPEAKSRINDLIDRVGAAKQSYAAFRGKLQDLGNTIGKKKIYGPQDFIDFIGDMNPQSLTKRLFNENNTEFSQWFSKEFPEEFQTMRNYQRGLLRTNAVKNEQFNPKAFLSSVFDSKRGLQPEMQRLLFSPEELHKLQAAKTYLGAFPENFNPSGTSHMSAFRSFFESPTGATIGNIRDFAIKNFVIGKDMSPKVLREMGRSHSDATAAAAMRALGEGHPGHAYEALNYAQRVEKGAKAINDAIGNLFKKGSQQAVNAYATEKDHEALKKYIESGEQNQQIHKEKEKQSIMAPKRAAPQNFAEGGEVSPVSNEGAEPILKEELGLAKVLPEHAMLLNMAKGRINNYLNSVRPLENGPRLAFDSEIKNTEKERSYDKAINIANQPLDILNKIKDGSITPEHVRHFTQLYPELHGHLSNKITERIMKSQMDEEKPSYRVRQGLSMFLGHPLDSTMTHQAIQSIQAIYAPKPPVGPPGVPPKKQTKNTSKMGKIAEDHYTGGQAAEKRQTAWD